MINFNGRLSFYINDDGIWLEIRDATSGTLLIEGRVSEENTLKVLSRMGHVEMSEAWAGSFERINKVMLMHELVFPVPGEGYGDGRKEEAKRIANEICPKGWVPDNNFSSQNSFFFKDGQRFARTTIRKWCDKGDVEHERIDETTRVYDGSTNSF